MLTRLTGAPGRKVGGALLVLAVVAVSLFGTDGSVSGQSPSSAPATPAGSAPIHLVIDGGPDAGTYDVRQDPQCSASDVVLGDWTAGITDDAGTPSLIVASYDPSLPDGASLTVGFGSDVDGVAYVAGPGATFSVDDRGATATISITGAATLVTAEADLPNVGTMSLTLTCSSIARGDAVAPAPPTPSTMPTTSALPGSGRNHFHIVLSGGPQAGTWDAATDEPCLAGADTASDWLASFSTSGGVPDSATVALYPDQPEQTGLNVEFTTPTGRISYANPIEGPLAMTSVDDRGASATLTVTVATQVYDASGNLSDGGQATISVECGNILRNPLQASPKP